MNWFSRLFDRWRRPAPPPPPPGPDPITALLRLHNQQRPNLPLAPDAALARAAQQQSDYQAECRHVGHGGPGGSTVLQRVWAAGASPGAVAENVAGGYTAPADVMTGWLGSPPHRRNILNQAYTRVGFGVAAAGGTKYWTAVFAGPDVGAGPAALGGSLIAQEQV